MKPMFLHYLQRNPPRNPLKQLDENKTGEIAHQTASAVSLNHSFIFPARST
jgi:hypothetical protein